MHSVYIIVGNDKSWTPIVDSGQYWILDRILDWILDWIRLVSEMDFVHVVIMDRSVIEVVIYKITFSVHVSPNPRHTPNHICFSKPTMNYKPDEEKPHWSLGTTGIGLRQAFRHATCFKLQPSDPV